MDYEVLQDAFVTRLQPFLSVGITAVRLPENEAERKRPKPTDVKFTVIYAGSEYGSPDSTAQISQEEKVFIQILIESTFLYGPKGVYALASLLKKVFTGFKPQGCKRFQVSKHHTIGQPDAEKKDNMWQYQVIFQSTSVHVEDYTEDLTPLLKKITFIDVPGGETNVVPNPDNIEN